MRWFRRARPAPAERIAIGNFNISAQLAGSSGRSMTVAGYVYSDDDKDALNARLDMYQEVIERQRLRSEIPELEAKRDQMFKGMMQAREVLDEMEKRARDGGTLSSQERMNMKNMAVNIAKVKEEIDKGEEAIIEAKLKAGVGA